MSQELFAPDLHEIAVRAQYVFLWSYTLKLMISRATCKRIKQHSIYVSKSMVYDLDKSALSQKSLTMFVGVVPLH